MAFGDFKQSKQEENMENKKQLKKRLSPIEMAAQIQEALYPLGHKIEGFRNNNCSKECGFILYITPYAFLPFGKNITDSAEVNNIVSSSGNSDNCFQSGE